MEYTLLSSPYGNIVSDGLGRRIHLYYANFLIKREDEAVRIIQRNAALYFDPWFRLFLVLKPHLKHFRLEEEIIQLKVGFAKLTGCPHAILDT